MIFRLRDLLIGQLTQTINALRGHLAEFGVVAGKGRENVVKLQSALETEEIAVELPVSVRHMAKLCFDQIADLSCRYRCLIPRFDGVILSQEWKEATWDKYVTGVRRSR